MRLDFSHPAMDTRREGASPGQPTTARRFPQYFKHLVSDALVFMGMIGMIKSAFHSEAEERATDLPFIMLFVSFTSRVELFSTQLAQSLLQFSRSPVEPSACKQGFLSK